MALTKTQVSQLYVAIFNRASEGEGNTFWQTYGDGTSAGVANAMLATTDAQTYFGSSLDSNQAFIEHIYLNTLNKTIADDPTGIAYWVGRLSEPGMTRGEVVAQLVAVVDTYAPGGSNYDPTDAVTIAAYNQFTNRVDVSNYTADTMHTAPADYATSTSFASPSNPNGGLTVTSDSTTVASAQAAVHATAVANNDAPVLADIPAAAYTENTTIAAGTVVATATATDANSDTLTYSITAGNTAGLFAIDAATGAISLVSAFTPDFETTPTYTLTVQATDGLSNSNTKNLVINITDVPASYTLTPNAATVKDGDTVNFTFAAVEDNGATTEITYTITGVNASDVVGGANALTGTATVVNGTATVSVTLLADAADGVAETMTATTVVNGHTLTASSTVADTSATPTNVTVTTTEVAIAGDAGEFITKSAGDTGTVNYTVNSSDASASLSAKLVVSGNANINITALTGSDTLIIDGTGNSVINAGAGADKIYLNSGNDVVVIAATGDFAAGSVIDGGQGVNTIRVSGTNDLTTGTITNIQNVILQAGSTVTLDEDNVAELSSIVANGTTAKLVIAAGVGTDTIDLSNVLSGSLAKLTVDNGVSVHLTAEQINNIASFATTGEIVTDIAGAELLAAKGYTPTIDAGAALSLESATTADVAGEAYVSYEINTTAAEAYDQLYLAGLAAAQLADTTGTGATTASINIAGTATVAQAEAIKSGVDTVASLYTVTDTAANIAGAMNATGNVLGLDGNAALDADNWLLASDLSGMTITTAATIAEAKVIFNAAGDLAAAVTAAAASDTDTLVITTPAYTISDTAANIVTDIADNSVLNATSVAVSIGAFSVANAVTVTTALGTKLTAYNLSDTAANLYGASSAVRNGATDITVTGTATVVQATRIDGYNNTGDTTYALSDTAAKLFTATTAILDHATSVASTTSLTVAQAAKIAPYFASSYVWTLSDTAANLTSDAALAMMGGDFSALTVTSTTALTLAQATTLEAQTGISTLTAYDITDTAANLLAAVNVFETDALGNNSAQTTAAAAAEAIIDAAVTAAKTVTATGGITCADATTLTTATIGNASIVYTLADTAANIAADVGGIVTGADSFTVTTPATAAEAVAIYALDNTAVYTISDTLANIAAQVGAHTPELAAATSIAVTNSTVGVTDAQSIVTLNGTLTTDLAYAISDTVTNLNLNVAVQANADLLTNATTTAIAGNTGAQIKTFATVTNAAAFALVDSYAITIGSDSAASALSTDIAAAPTYYDGATSITISTANLSVANAGTDYGIVLADSNSSKLSFADIAGTAASFTGANANQTAAIALAVSASVTNGVDVATANTIDGMVAGTLLLESTLTDTAANLETAATLFTAIEAGSGSIVVSDDATVAQYTTLLGMIDTAGIAIGSLSATVSDTIENVQGASTALLGSLGTNTINLQAGSEVSLSVAQAAQLSLTATATDDIFKADGLTKATYEIVDTIENLVNAIDGGANEAILDNGSTIIATGGVTIPQAYLADLETLTAKANFDVVDSTYSISGLAATLAGGTVDTAVSNATAVTVTDAASVLEATNILGNNTSATFTLIEDTNVANALFTFDSNGVASYASATVQTMIADAAYNVSIITNEITVAQAQAIATLLGANATLDYMLNDTAENLAAAGNVLANATAIIVNNGADNNATVAQLDAIMAGVNSSFDITTDITYDIQDTASALAAASQDYYDNYNSAVSVVAGSTATIAEATSIETKDAAGQAGGIAIDVVDTAANVAAGIADAYTAGLNAGGADTITLTTAATMAEAVVLAAYTGDIDAAASVNGTSATTTGEVYISDTAANLLAAANATGYTDAAGVVVTDTINVSKAQQIADAWNANDGGTIATADAALALMTFNIVDAQAYIIQAFSENNSVLGAAASITVDGVGAITVDQLANAGDYYITGTVDEIAALPSALLAVGFIVNDTVANIAAAPASVIESDNLNGTVVTDTGANILAADLTVTGVATEVHVTDTISTADLSAMQNIALNLYTIEGVEDSAANLIALSAGALNSGNQDVATVTVTDATISVAQVNGIVTAGAAANAANVVYNLSDASTAFDFNAAGGYDQQAIVENAQAVTVTGNLTVVNAGLVYDWNANATITVSDTEAALSVLTTATPNATQQAQIDAINVATSVSLTAGQTVTVAEATALLAVGGFDGVYTLSDTAANLAAADSALLADAVQVRSTSAATVAEAEILSVLPNIETTTVSSHTYANFTITDTAAHIAAASASLLDNVATITFSAATATDDDVTAAQMQALKTLDSDTAVLGLDLTADTADVVDTLANITATANTTGMAAASNVTVTDGVTLAQAASVIAKATSAGTIAYDLVDTRTHLQGATAAQESHATSVTVTDDITAAQAAVINSIYTTAGTANTTFAKVTGTMAELTTTIIGEATTVDVTDAMTVAELEAVDGSGFLANVGSKLVGGYDVEDSVDNIVNASENNAFSHAVVANAAHVSLTGSTTMNIAASSVITALNFTGAYDIADTVTAISGASASLINGATTTTVNFVDGVTESFNATAYTSTVLLDMSTNFAAVTQAAVATVALSGVDVVTLSAGTNYSLDLGIVPLHNQVAVTAFDANSANDFTMYYGYRTGDGFVVDSANAQDTLIVWSDAGDAEDAVVLDGMGTVTINGTTVLSGTANDSFNLTSGSVDTIVFAASAALNGADTLTGLDLATDALDFSNFIGTTAAVAVDTTGVNFTAGLDLTTNNVGFVYNKATLTAADIATVAGVSKIAVADNGKAVVFTNADANGAGIATDGTSNWHVYMIQDTNAGAGQTWDVTLVGTIVTNSSIDTAGKMDGFTIV